MKLLKGLVLHKYLSPYYLDRKHLMKFSVPYDMEVRQLLRRQKLPHFLSLGGLA
jgi:hypothetical protein